MLKAIKTAPKIPRMSTIQLKVAGIDILEIIKAINILQLILLIGTYMTAWQFITLSNGGKISCIIRKFN